LFPMELVSAQAWFQKKLPHKPSAAKAYYVNDRNEGEVTKEGCKAVRQLMISLRYIVIALIVVAFIFPIYWMILTSIKPAHEVIAYPPVFFSSHPTLDGYAEAIAARGGLVFKNSLIIAGFTTVAALACMAIIPVIVLVITSQRYLVRGLTLGAIK